MVWTIVSKRRDGFYNQKIKVEVEGLETLEVIGKSLARADSSSYNVEYYEGTVPRGDLWGRPKYIIKNHSDSDSKLQEFTSWD